MNKVKESVLIVGKGKVGLATAARLSADIYYHDPYKEEIESNPNRHDYAIIAVDSLQAGPNDYSDLVSALDYLASFSYKGLVAIRSTVSISFLDILEAYDLRVIMFPEFMSQRGVLVSEDPWSVILGGEQQLTNSFMNFLINNGYLNDLDKYHLVSIEESVVIKLGANAALAAKVVLFNAIYGICKDIGIDYETVRSAITSDKRINGHHTVVPSPDDGQLGFGGHCLPKDILAISEIDGLGFFRAVSDINLRLRNK